MLAKYIYNRLPKKKLEATDSGFGRFLNKIVWIRQPADF
jgi:hypothetical protein